ncbi:ribokinase [Pararhodobacter sp.]|uniref:ribokinase n=1 Tax=Pararhodobacter sp. TaxID=2127056 RepID=UPI002AFE58C8|nr:ribokinase [Pararhodobacter sp.]
MTIYCVGSINIDNVYRLPHLPQAGETLAAASFTRGLGGKGVNQSIAALRAGSSVVHIGAIGQGDRWIEAELTRHGIALDAITRVDASTGHAIIAVDDAAENQIIIFSGANQQQSVPAINVALSAAKPGDCLLLQNETSHQVEAAQSARSKNLSVFYSAAPFVLAPLQAVLPFVTHLLVNAGEAEALQAATGTALTDLPVEAVIVTRGSQGAEWISAGSEPLFVPSFRVDPVDTTGAGDCFAGSLAAALDQGQTRQQAMRYAAAAAALQVTKLGAAGAIPTRTQVAAFLVENS